MLNKRSLIPIGLILSLQLPGNLGSFVFFLSIALIAVGRGEKSTKRSLKFAFGPALIGGLLLLGHYFFHLNDYFVPPDIISVLHGSAYILLLVSMRGGVQLTIPERTIALITAINLLILFSGVNPFSQELAFTERANGARFTSYFSEPARAAFAFCIHVLIMSKARSVHLRYFVIAASSIMVLFTFSGGGIILLVVALWHWQTAKWLVPVGAGILAGALLFGLALPNEVDTILMARAERILSEDLTNSSFLRFVAPFMVLGEAVQDPRTALSGIGIGNIAEFLFSNWGQFGYMRNFAGERVEEINNGYVIVLVLFGIPAGLGLLSYLTLRLFRSDEAIRKKVFFLLLPMFSSAFFAPIFWFTFYLAGGALSFSQSGSQSGTPKRRLGLPKGRMAGGRPVHGTALRHG